MRILCAIFTGLFLIAGLCGFDVSRSGKKKCMDCHQDMKVEQVVHYPFKEQQCEACHDPVNLTFTAEKNKLCFTCHIDMAEGFGKKVVHTPVKGGDCLECHLPHSSGGKHLLSADPPELCYKCHARIQAESNKKVVHPPFGSGECLTCHQAHSSDSRGLLNAGGGRLCFTCHSSEAEMFKKAHNNYSVAESDCVTCHSPHGSDAKKLLFGNEHYPFRERQCGVCHKADNSGKLEAVSTDVCFSCHDKKDFSDVKFTHPPAQEGQCLICHRPHCSSEEHLLAESQTGLCSTCHQGQYAGMVIPHPSDVKPSAKVRIPAEGWVKLTSEGSVGCTTCHFPHGSNSVFFLKAPVDNAQMCGTCHQM
jgi:predicted CXXCH cytochrome family protein